jgi:hypothetical protein
MLSYFQTLWPIESMQIRCSGYGAEYASFSWRNVQLGSSAIESPSFCHTWKSLFIGLCTVWIKPIRRGGRAIDNLLNLLQVRMNFVLGSCATNNLRRTLFLLVSAQSDCGALPSSCLMGTFGGSFPRGEAAVLKLTGYVRVHLEPKSRMCWAYSLCSLHILFELWLNIEQLHVTPL